ncbi:MAG: 30S ribosomal protein S6 [Candidatus Daviesbacteria bacterium]|nr:MAG: 30S ribosomal protein S6 [Candidatus Daviesbacteria bacterium]
MNSYLLTLVLKSDLEDQARQTLLADVKKKMSKVVKEDLWGERSLAYPIKKQSKGYFIHFEFETEPKEAVDLDKSLKVEEDILRYLLVRA